MWACVGTRQLHNQAAAGCGNSRAVGPEEGTGRTGQRQSRPAAAWDSRMVTSGVEPTSYPLYLLQLLCHFLLCSVQHTLLPTRLPPTTSSQACAAVAPLASAPRPSPAYMWLSAAQRWCINHTPSFVCMYHVPRCCLATLFPPPPCSGCHPSLGWTRGVQQLVSAAAGRLLVPGAPPLLVPMLPLNLSASPCGLGLSRPPGQAYACTQPSCLPDMSCLARP